MNEKISANTFAFAFTFALDFSIKSRGRKSSSLSLRVSGFSPQANVFKEKKNIMEIMMHFFHPASKSATFTTGSMPINPTKIPKSRLPQNRNSHARPSVGQPLEDNARKSFPYPVLNFSVVIFRTI